MRRGEEVARHHRAARALRVVLAAARAVGPAAARTASAARRQLRRQLHQPVAATGAPVLQPAALDRRDAARRGPDRVHGPRRRRRAAVARSIRVYERLVATRAARRMSFHAFCSWIAALVVLPMVLLVPVERALPISLLAVGAWLLLTLPLSLYSLPRWRNRVAWIVGMIVVPFLFWGLRAQIPAAGLAVTDARVTQTIDGLTPGAPARACPAGGSRAGRHRIRRDSRSGGLVAAGRVRVAAQRRARADRRRDSRRQGGRLPGLLAQAGISGRIPSGLWTVDVLTPQAQLLERLRFVVEG